MECVASSNPQYNFQVGTKVWIINKGVKERMRLTSSVSSLVLAEVMCAIWITSYHRDERRITFFLSYTFKYYKKRMWNILKHPHCKAQQHHYKNNNICVRGWSINIISNCEMYANTLFACTKPSPILDNVMNEREQGRTFR